MGYLFLSAALLCGAVKGFCGKKTSGCLKTFRDSVYICLVRMMLCALIGAVITWVGGGMASFAVSGRVLCIAALAGVSSAVFILTWILSVRTGAYMMVDVFLTAGVIIPVLFCHIFYDEAFGIKHVLGFFLLLLAVVVMCGYNKTIKAPLTLVNLLLLTVCGLSNGFTDLLQKVFAHSNEQSRAGNAAYNFYTYCFAFDVFAIVFAVLYLRGHACKKKEPFVPLGSVLPYLFLMALCLFLNSYFKTFAASVLPSTVLYPISQVVGMMLSIIMSALFFEEKITFRCVFGSSMAVAALLIINL